MNKLIQKKLETSNYTVFFGGAGVSTESGIPDFKSKNGLYNQRWNCYSPEVILSNSFFYEHTDIFFDFYRKILLAPNLGPNRVHKKLYEWEMNGKLNAIITQNIDGLHQMAGSKNVIEMHGNVLSNYCIKCNHEYSAQYILNSRGVPQCLFDGEIIKPNIVLYEENLSDNAINAAIHHISLADLLIVGGTSLSVYPVAGLLNYFQGNELVIINKDRTEKDEVASLIINSSIGDAIC